MGKSIELKRRKTPSFDNVLCLMALKRQKDWSFVILKNDDMKTKNKLLNFFMTSVILFKMGKNSDFHLSFSQIVGAWREFTAATKLIKKNLRVYMVWGCFVKIIDDCMDFEPYFKVRGGAEDSWNFRICIIQQKWRHIRSKLRFLARKWRFDYSRSPWICKPSVSFHFIMRMVRCSKYISSTF